MGRFAADCMAGEQAFELTVRLLRKPVYFRGLSVPRRTRDWDLERSFELTSAPNRAVLGTGVSGPKPPTLRLSPCGASSGAFGSGRPRIRRGPIRRTER